MMTKASIQKAIQWYIAFIQKIIIIAGLFIIYVVGFGGMAVLSWFQRLRAAERDSKANSFWKHAEGYDETLSDCMRES